MTAEEKDKLRVVVQTLADPKGNWSYAWKVLCELAEMDVQSFLPPFRQRPLDNRHD